MITSLFLFSFVLKVGLTVTGGGTLSYESVFRVVAYTTVLIGILQALLGLGICGLMPKALWDPAQSLIEVLLMIWQGYALAIGCSVAVRVFAWKLVPAIVCTMILAYAAQEIMSPSNPTGGKFWNAIFHAI
jgi:hypothetical protein